MFASLITGTMLGLSVAAPFGPISLLCVQRSILAGPWLGVATGLGAACVQGLYAAFAISGAGIAATYLAEWGQAVRLISAALLIVLGTRVLLRRPPVAQTLSRPRAHVAFASSFSVALCNPLTVLPYLLVASSAATIEAADAPLTAWSIPGVLVGATAWYAAVSTAAAMFRSSLSEGATRVLNHAAGTLLIGFGLMVGCR
ncbi:LysE family translocator [Roseomonas elaeocarpi]|uniref:LysE family translocator n=1 Tax=Roseomonas elaeocarpi TaxID=907779 RepID=A0ABV6JNI1_9PROT